MEGFSTGERSSPNHSHSIPSPSLCASSDYTPASPLTVQIQPQLMLNSVLTYIDVSATNAGIDPSFDVYLLAISNASSGGCRIVGGLLADRIGSSRHPLLGSKSTRSRLHDDNGPRPPPLRNHHLRLAVRGHPGLARRHRHHLRVCILPYKYESPLILALASRPASSRACRPCP